jgi:hypothetical protein
MQRFVVSAPRSGLNWVRFSVEHFYGNRTRGHRLIYDKSERPDAAFVRSHDALSWFRNKEDAKIVAPH